MSVLHTLLWGVAAMAQVDAVEVARHYVSLLSSGKLADAAGMHDARMKELLTEPLLASTVKKVMAKGPFKDCQEQANTVVQAFHVVILDCATGDERILVKVSVDSLGKVGGLYFSPAPAVGMTAPAGPAPYVDAKAFSEEKVVVKTGRFELPGTLCVPRGKGPFPAVVLVAGSGPHDEDETIGPNKPLRDVAQGLASRGVMTLRYEKRTHKYGADISDDKDHYTVQHEVVEDAVSAARLLMARTDVSGVLVLGHSLGGNMIPRIGQQLPALKGLVVMAGNVSPLEDLIVAQVDHIQAHGSKAEAGGSSMGELRAMAAAVKKMQPGSPPLMGAPASYWLDLRGYNPAVQAASLTQPLLLLQGGRDYQVPPAELEKWKAGLGARKDVLTHTYPALNHLFMEGTGPSVPTEYLKPAHVNVNVIDDVAAFARSKAGR
jgi:dienelactone hydrolase